MLSPLDRQSALSVKMREHLTARLSVLRVENDKPVSEAETAATRGAIKEIKALLKLFEEPPKPAPRKQANY